LDLRTVEVFKGEYYVTRSFVIGHPDRLQWADEVTGTVIQILFAEYWQRNLLGKDHLKNVIILNRSV
jgi:hypothetical protein